MFFPAARATTLRVISGVVTTPHDEWMVCWDDSDGWMGFWSELRRICGCIALFGYTLVGSSQINCNKLDMIMEFWDIDVRRLDSWVI